jgi:hypothetical protein
MKEKEEFFVPYIEGSLGKRTRKSIRRFALLAVLVIAFSAIIFSIAQKPFKDSTFELTTITKITGVYHESPYPMLRVQEDGGRVKSILLLGFGKSSANPFLEKIRSEVPYLQGQVLSIEGNLIYYNDKTLIQITDEDKVVLADHPLPFSPPTVQLGEKTLQGEIVDPKCYFGVMKPGKGKIHRSCAVRCIAGGIPPVFATTDDNDIAQYFLITDLEGNPINEEILSHVGKPADITGAVEKLEDWYVLKIDPKNIKELGTESQIY